MGYPGGDRYQYENHSTDVPWQASGSDPTVQTPMKRVGYW